MKNVLVVIGLLAMLGLGVIVGVAVSRRGAADVVASGTVYHCPMHPQIVSDRPGSCPICQMRLVPRTPSGSGADAGRADGIPGWAEVTLTDRGRRLIGARTVVAEEVRLAHALRTVGIVAVDERRVHHVHTKIPGWIEHLSVGAVGDEVRLGEGLLTIYSPELLASQGEYLVARAHRGRLTPTTLPEVVADADRLVEAARRRLVLYDMTAEQIAELERTGAASRTVTLYSPVEGTITGRNVSHGEMVQSATSLLDIANLDRVWVVADVFPADLPFVKQGQPATVRVAYIPGRVYSGRVALVSPLVDATTRTVPVRLEFDNPGLALKPGMFTQVELEADLGPRLAVPKTAVLRSGTRDLVFVDAGDGRFVPREVTLGVSADERHEIVRGLAAGERVLAAASFFVDAESKLEAGFEAGR
jgi:membrane fusion protein, copper/silver efflux system